MARYEYHCVICDDVHERRRATAERDLPSICSCGGVARRAMSVPGGLGGKATEPPVVGAPAPTTTRPGPTFINCSVSNGHTAVQMNGGHANFDGFAVSKCPIAFDLSNGATVDLRNTVYEP